MIVVVGLFDEVTRTFVNDATTQLTLYTSEGGAVVDGAEALDMTYRAASNGDYYAPFTLPDELREAGITEGYGILTGVGAWAGRVDWRGAVPFVDRKL
jgi:hypothetical protein